MTDEERWLKELEMCRAALSGFDKSLQDLRKFGFSLVTVLLGSSGFLFSAADPNKTLGSGVILGIFVALLILIYVLFSQDRVQQIFIRSAVMRALQLELRLGMRMTFQITYWSERIDTATWGIRLYAFFIVANTGLALSGLLERGLKLSDGAPIATLLLAGIALILVWREHSDAKDLRNRFKHVINEMRPADVERLR